MELLRDLVIHGYKPGNMKKWDCFSHLLMPLKDCERTLKKTFHLHIPLSLWFIVCGAVDSGQGFTGCKGLSTELHGCPLNEMAINKTLTEDTDRAEQLMRVSYSPFAREKGTQK